MAIDFLYTLIELVVIENPESVVGISMLSVIVPEVLAAMLILPVAGRYYTHLSTLFSAFIWS